MSSVEELYGRLIDELGQFALRHVRPRISSQTLRRGVVYQRLNYNKGRLFIPHYWAIMQHDGRRGFPARRAQYLVYFADPKDDPRLPKGSYPVRFSQVRRLTADEFREGMQINRQMYADNPSGGSMQYMIVRGSVARTGPEKSYKFFEDGMRTVPTLVAPIVRAHMARLVQFARTVDRSTATARIR